MTHDPLFGLRFIGHQNVISAAIVHDFIPVDWYGYLETISDRIEYFARLSWLRKFMMFLPNSQYTARRLREMLGIDASDTIVTGCAIRSTIFKYALDVKQPSTLEPSPYFLTVSGGDRRKNAEIVVRAVRLLNPHLEQKVRLRIVGHYTPEYKTDLEHLAGGIDPFLEFWPGIDDRTLVALYSGALATIVPSHIEGFSIPVVEASICGCPVIASNCAAHVELVESPDALFDSDSLEQLVERLKRVITEREFRQRLMLKQAPLAQRFHEEVVGERFWTTIIDRFGQRFRKDSPRVCLHAKPKLAFLSPFPPDQSGVARFSELTLNAARQLFDIDIYTDALRPISLPEGVRDLGRIGTSALIKNKYDSIVSVIGNSHFHTPILEVFERYGGPCIMHDSRLTHIYFHRLGESGFLSYAAKLLGRPVSIDEAHVWLRDQQLPSLFIEQIVERASPIMVHTIAYKHLLRERYNTDAQVLTFPPNMWFRPEELAAPNRSQVRSALGIPNNAFVISTFGFLGRAKGVYACISALELLRSWQIPAELFLIGNAMGLDSDVQRVASDFGVLEHVHLSNEFVPDARYRAFMIASDAAVQLRTYGLGQPSAGLVDCISAGIPSVANTSLADACDAPSYVSRIPDNISALLLSERLADAYEIQLSRSDTEDERTAYCQRHSFEFYAERLSEILNV